MFAWIVSMAERYFLLIYEAGDNYVERRAPMRAAHIALAREAEARGDLVSAGALADPIDGSLLIFKGPTAAGATRFAESDPYVVNGLIRSWRVREWTPVIGAFSSPAS